MPIMIDTRHNPVLQFVAEAVARIDGNWYALSCGAWLVCKIPEINKHCRLGPGRQLFRDYWKLACYDDGCGLATNLHDNILKAVDDLQARST